MVRRFLILCMFLGAASGCVERRYLVVTDPPGAIVYNEKNYPIGASPADSSFPYYGVYQFTLVRDGYQTQIVRENLKAPWYEWGPLEFVSENLIPWTIRDTRTFQYTMMPTTAIAPENILQSATQLRERGHAIGTAP